MNKKQKFSSWAYKSSIVHCLRVSKAQDSNTEENLKIIVVKFCLHKWNVVQSPQESLYRDPGELATASSSKSSVKVDEQSLEDSVVQLK